MVALLNAVYGREGVRSTRICCKLILLAVVLALFFILTCLAPATGSKPLWQGEAVTVYRMLIAHRFRQLTSVLLLLLPPDQEITAPS